MQTLIVYYSLTGKTRSVVTSMAHSLSADVAEIRPIAGSSRLRAYTVGLLRAMAHRSTDILPVEADVSAYDCIIVAGPVWGGNPAPALYDFIREYDLAGRQTYGLLTCAKEGKRAAKVLRGELEKTGATCRSVISVRTVAQTLEALKNQRMSFVYNEEGKIVLRASSELEAEQKESPSEGE